VNQKRRDEDRLLSRRAISNFVNLREHIEPDSEQSAAAVAKRIMEAVDLLQSHPEMGRPGRVVGTRELVVPGAPYLVPYRVRARATGTDCCIPRAPRSWPVKL